MGAAPLGGWSNRVAERPGSQFPKLLAKRMEERGVIPRGRRAEEPDPGQRRRRLRPGHDRRRDKGRAERTQEAPAIPSRDHPLRRSLQ